jgi:hypothetical protein
VLEIRPYKSERPSHPGHLSGYISMTNASWGLKVSWSWKSYCIENWELGSERTGAAIVLTRGEGGASAKPAAGRQGFIIF